MRQISDELLLKEIKALIESKKTPLTKEEIINWTYSENNRNYYKIALSQGLTFSSEKIEKLNEKNSEIVKRNENRFKQIRELINSLEDLLT